MYNVDYPYHFDDHGRTATAAVDDHIRNLIEQVLFTAPGERVNRPQFGSGIMQAVFEPNGAEMAAATQFLVQGALQQNLGDLIEVNSVEVTALDNVLSVAVRYVVRNTHQQKISKFTRGGLSQ